MEKRSRGKIFPREEKSKSPNKYYLVGRLTIFLFLMHGLQGFLRLHAKGRQMRKHSTQKIKDAEQL